MVTKQQIEVLASRNGYKVTFSYNRDRQRLTCELTDQYTKLQFRTLADAKQFLVPSVLTSSNSCLKG